MVRKAAVPSRAYIFLVYVRNTRVQSSNCNHSFSMGKTRTIYTKRKNQELSVNS